MYFPLQPQQLCRGSQKELDFPVGVGRRTKQTGYLCPGCFGLPKKPQPLDGISTYEHGAAGNAPPGLSRLLTALPRAPRELEAPKQPLRALPASQRTCIRGQLSKPRGRRSVPRSREPFTSLHLGSTSPRRCRQPEHPQGWQRSRPVPSSLPAFCSSKDSSWGWVEVTARISSLLLSFTLEQKPGNLSSSPLGTASGAHAAGADERCSQIYFFLACLRWWLLAAWLLLQPGYRTPSTRSATRRGRSAGFG